MSAKNNKLIAEFMGLDSFKDSLASLHQGNINLDVDLYEQSQYHTSWDWLMPVINKIKSMNSTYKVEEVVKYDWDCDCCSEISHYEFDLELTYKSVIEWIKKCPNLALKEYNNQNKKQW
jgi:hypothetical protein